MNVLLIGSGGREHALAWAIAASPLLTRLFIAPGNPGTAECGENVALDVRDHGAVITFCQLMNINLVVVGPEAPLVAGLADDLCAAGLKVFGHGRDAARLEGSKAFTKEICDAAGVPTAAYGRFRDASAAKAHITHHGAPIVVKYDGLAAGKGVVVAMTVEEADAAVDMMFAGQFGDAEVVIEEFMEGEEVSFFALVKGEQTLALAAAQDHKRVGDGDTGPNTGGMGAYSPAPVFTPALEAEVMDRIIRPTAREMARRGAPCAGVLFAGLMLTAEGPKLIEYNVRFGDPECQVLMLRLRADILTLLLATAEDQLDKVSARWTPETALTVVMAAKGYPDTPLKGTVISGLDHAAELEGVTIFHAGTRRDAAGRLLADGGRVLNVSAVGTSVAETRDRAYAAVDAIDWPDGFCRRDIAWRALKG